MPMKLVMNVEALVFSQMTRFMWAVTSFRSRSIGSITRRHACRFAMSSEAGIPLPVTSATIVRRRPPSSLITSK